MKAVHKIMDHTGHATIEFDKSNTVDLDAAMQRFDELTGNGHVAATRKTGDTDYKRIKSFDQEQDETLFAPQMVGG